MPNKLKGKYSKSSDFGYGPMALGIPIVAGVAEAELYPQIMAALRKLASLEKEGGINEKILDRIYRPLKIFSREIEKHADKYGSFAESEIPANAPLYTNPTKEDLLGLPSIEEARNYLYKVGRGPVWPEGAASKFPRIPYPGLQDTIMPNVMEGAYHRVTPDIVKGYLKELQDLLKR